MVQRALRLLLLALGLVPLVGTVALADDGPPRALAAGPSRPPETVQRIVGSGRREMLMVVGGYNSDPSRTDDFAVMAARFPEYRITYFGQGDAHYDTRGPFAPNAAALAAAIRKSVREDDFAQVHVVAHSMGGAVADAAFESGLGRRDNVTSYTPIAAPHRGSTLALATEATLFLAGPAREETARAMQWVGGSGGDDPAMRDLARRRRPEAPAAVRTVEISVVNDALVFGIDAGLGGARRHTVFVPPQSLDDAFRAHGLVLHDRTVVDALEANVRNEPAVRPWWRELAAETAQLALDPVRMHIVVVLGTALLAAGYALHLASRLGVAPWSP